MTRTDPTATASSDPSRQPEHTQAETARTTALPRVLFVDDDLNLLHAMGRLLRRTCNTTAVGSPSEALGLLEQDSAFEVIVSDFHMEGMTGVEFLARAADLAPHTIRILLTGSANLATAIDAINLGKVFRFVSKPVQADELIATIEAASSQYQDNAHERGELLHLQAQLAADARLVDEKRRRVEKVLQGGIRTVFQPIVRLHDLTVVGHEALSRFPSDPERTPDVWFDEADDIALGVALDTAAMRTALRTWDRVGPNGSALWLNLSPATVISGMATDRLLDCNHDLVIEITERAPVNDYGVLRDALEPFRSNGARLAIDDVGAGYSSLRHLTELTPDIVKLDRSLITDLSADSNKRALVASLTAFASARGLMALGEGVETLADAEALVELGAELAQGYFYGRPCPTPATAVGGD